MIRKVPVHTDGNSLALTGSPTGADTTRSTPTGREVMIHRGGQFLFLDPQGEEALAGLKTSRIVAGPSENGHGYRAEPIDWEMFTHLGGRGVPQTLACWAGLERAVRLLLTRSGFVVVDRIASPVTLPEPNHELLKEIDPNDASFLGLVRRRERGVVVHDQEGVCPARLVAQIALAWVGLTITVAVKRIDEAYSFRKQLRRHIPDVECYHTRHHPERSARVAVATYDFLDHRSIDLFHRDIVVVLNAREGCCPDAQQQLAKALRARLFGLLPISEEPSPFERDQLTKLYGFELVYVPSHGQRMRPVQTLFLRATGKARLPDKANMIERLRAGVWRNALRNRRIARLARLIAAGEYQQLRKQFPAVAAAVAGKSLRGVVVLVDGIEHALALAGRMLGWDIISGQERWLGGLSAGQEQAVLNNAILFPSDTPRVIMTGTECVDISTVDVVIRADAGVALPSLVSQGLVEPGDAPEQPLLLIDFLDRDDPVLKLRSRQRLETYENAGWFGVGVDPVQKRVEAFLKARG